MALKINSQMFFIILYELVTLPYFLFHTMLKVPIKGAIKIFKSDDPIQPPNQVSKNEGLLEEWQAFQTKYDSSQKKVHVFLKFVASKITKYIIMTIILSIVASVLGFYKPMALKNFFNYIETKGQGSYYHIIAVFISIQLLQLLVSEIRWTKNNLLHLNMHNMVKNLMCQKILKLSNATKKYLQTGKIMSYHNADVGAIGGFIHHSIFGVIAPVRLIMGCFYLYNQIGWLFVGAPIISFYAVYRQYYIRKLSDKIQKKQNLISDQLSKLVNQYLSGIRVLKYYGWEGVAKDKISEIKDKRQDLQYQNHKNWHGNGVLQGFLFNSFTVFMVILSFLGYIKLSLSSYLILSTVVGMIREGINQLNEFYTNYKRVMISVQRLTNFLCTEQIQRQENDQNLQKGEIVIKDAKFRYRTERSEKENQIRLQVIDEGEQVEKQASKQEIKVDQVDLTIDQLNINKGEFVAITGKIGSGKSTLISGIIGEISRFSGIVRRNGSISYCPQIPWLKNNTIKQNIVFHNEWNQQKYEQIISLCELKPDFEVLDKGDNTLVGEKGVKLSGGQKQRISIARCLYANKDINIFDDCLSALDAGVGKNIFHNGIRKYLLSKGKTVLLSLNALEYLQYFDKCVLMSEQKVVTVGKVDDVMKFDESFFEFANKLNSHNEQGQKQQESKDEENVNQFDALRSSSSASESTSQNQKKINKNCKKQKAQQQKQKDADKLAKQKQERQQEQQIQVLKLLSKLLTIDGKKIQLLFFTPIIFGIFLNISTDFWMGQFAQTSDIVYSQIIAVICLSVMRSIFDYGNSMILWKVGKQKGQSLCKKYLQRIFHAKLTWFDSIPTHQIVCRAIAYQDQVRHSFNWLAGWALWVFCGLTFKLCFIAYTDKTNVILFIVIAYCLSFISRFFNEINKKFDEQIRVKSEKYGSVLQESTTGTILIRAFNKEDSYVEELNTLHLEICDMHTFSHNTRGSLRTLSHKFFSLTLISISLSLILSKVCDTEKDPNCGLSVLVLSIAVRQMIGIVDQINGFFHMKENIERIMRKLNKILKFMEKCEIQKEYTQPQPQKDWLHSGECKVDNISYRYKNDLPIVLQDISLQVYKGQKVGIVGRTGSGKSTMTLGLLRILEACKDQNGYLGKIQMDETNIADIGLHYLRHSVAIIPQDPLLFSGTFRSNIDPFKKASDEEIKKCLQKVNLWNDIKEKEGESDPIKSKLDSQVEEGGNNYSVGQRQLICLARALIRNPKVLLMDEATANIDLQTDQFIQKMLSQQFKDTTVITIAHRLNTIINYDKIMVLQKGRVKQIGEPLALLTDENSFFGNNIKKIGKKYYNQMVELARAKHI